MEFQYIEGSATFAGGGTIPNNISQLVGTYNFHYGHDATGFIRLGALWGATMKEIESCGNLTEVKCTQTKEGTVCEVVRKCP